MYYDRGHRCAANAAAAAAAAGDDDDDVSASSVSKVGLSFALDLIFKVLIRSVDQINLFTDWRCRRLTHTYIYIYNIS